jgi:dTDP-4-amino-4,6-dideoxygalactose transaminase
MSAEPILVTRPFLPELDELQKLLDEIWQNRWLTNTGPIHQRFQQALVDHFQLPHVSLYANGTLALEIALQALDLPPGSEVVTSPFTFVATAHAIARMGFVPVFADVEPAFGTLDPVAVENAISPNTSAILPVHVYGYPCRTEAFDRLAGEHNLRLIYDAAHAFGVTLGDRSIAAAGDVSMFSLHATKLMHSVEGGLLVCHDPEVHRRAESLRNFGLDDAGDIPAVGTNAKMSELHAAVGLLALQNLPDLLERRAIIAQRYRQQLANIPGVQFFPDPPANVTYNHAYLPVRIDPDAFGIDRDRLAETLAEHTIHPRKYFYPVLPDFTCYRNAPGADRIPHARKLANQILCLPIYHNLDLNTVDRIADIILGSSRQQHG